VSSKIKIKVEIFFKAISIHKNSQGIIRQLKENHLYTENFVKLFIVFYIMNVDYIISQLISQFHRFFLKISAKKFTDEF
jgi:hypothetical protein